MRLGDIARNAEIERPPKKKRPLMRAVICLSIAAVGCTALWIRLGNPVIQSSPGVTKVLEAVVDLPFAESRWHVVDVGQWAFAIPFIHKVHTVRNREQTSSFKVVAQTKSGLQAVVGPILLRYSTPPQGAVDQLRILGNDVKARDNLVRMATAVAVRDIFARTADATVGDPLDIENLTPAVKHRVADALAPVGIKVSECNLGSLRFDRKVDALIQRLRAAKNRTAAALTQEKQDQAEHHASMRKIRKQQADRIKKLNEDFEPRVKEAEKAGKKLKRDAEVKFSVRKNRVLIRRQVSRIGGDAKEYRLRKEAEALGIRVKAAGKLPPPLVYFELGQHILRQFGAIQDAESSSTNSQETR